MAFRAKLLLDGSEFEALSCDYSFHRDTDAKGRPVTSVYGGTVRVVVESNDDTDVVAQLMNQFEPFSGSITFHRGGDPAKLKELTWENGYIMRFSESFDMTNREPMKMYFEISAEKISMEGEEVDHKWPK